MCPLPRLHPAISHNASPTHHLLSGVVGYRDFTLLFTLTKFPTQKCDRLLLVTWNLLCAILVALWCGWGVFLLRVLWSVEVGVCGVVCGSVWLGGADERVVVVVWLFKDAGMGSLCGFWAIGLWGVGVGGLLVWVGGGEFAWGVGFGLKVDEGWCLAWSLGGGYVWLSLRVLYVRVVGGVLVGVAVEEGVWVWCGDGDEFGGLSFWSSGRGWRMVMWGSGALGYLPDDAFFGI
ncbi:hypothetical protein Tco_0513475 [Tanacetum coccineum]